MPYDQYQKIKGKDVQIMSKSAWFRIDPFWEEPGEIGGPMSKKMKGF
jgi:hypothetical protein